MFQVADHRLNGRAPPESRSHFGRLVFALSWYGPAGQQHLRAVDLLSSAIAAIHNGFGRLVVGDGPRLFQCRAQRVAVINVFFVRHRAVAAMFEMEPTKK